MIFVIAQLLLLASCLVISIASFALEGENRYIFLVLWGVFVSPWFIMLIIHFCRKKYWPNANPHVKKVLRAPIFLFDIIAILIVLFFSSIAIFLDTMDRLLKRTNKEESS